ncbi:28S ribosomal protein S28, mitochondrial-like, partial [Homalodisca vitripennis]|uniref:28S ribosomal protein S28, mitochondrial-like n=1 Tax=Homalodisca vitripennis TaxID=197043 RepID=UPI001EEB9CAB
SLCFHYALKTVANLKVYRSIDTLSFVTKRIDTYSSRFIKPNFFVCQYSSSFENDQNKELEEHSKKGGFAKAFDKFTAKENVLEEKEPSFLNLLKNSKFVDLGDPEGKIVTGTIFNVVDDDLYVDFGWKFHCVVTRPSKNGHEYVRGARVRLSLRDLELSSRFLGSEKDLTLLEADATLLGLISSPTRSGVVTSAS